MNMVLELGNIRVLKKRDSLSDVVGWHMLHWLPGHQWGTHLSSLGLWADEETRAETEQVKALYEAAPSPRHSFSTAESQREWRGTEMLGFSRSAVGPAPDQYWAVSIRNSCPLSWGTSSDCNLGSTCRTMPALISGELWSRTLNRIIQTASYF